MNTTVNPQVQQFMNGYLGIVILGLMIIIAVIWWIKTLLKNNPNMTIGDLLNVMFMREKLSIFILGAIFLNLVEGFTAASITPIGEAAANPLARILSHTIISIAGITCGLALPSTFFILFEKPKFWAWHFLIFIGSLFGTFYLPWVNLSLIANGLKQTQVLHLYVMDLFPWNNMQNVYARLRLQGIKVPINFNPIDAMPYILAVAVKVTWVHYFLTNLDGAHLILKNKMDAAAKKDNKDDKKNPVDYAKDYVKDDPIKALIKFYSNGSLTTKEEETYIRLAHQSHDSMETRAKAAVSSKNATYIDMIKSFEKDYKNSSAEDKKKRKIEIREDIRTFFGASKQKGEGYGLTLAKVDMNKDPN